MMCLVAELSDATEDELWESWGMAEGTWQHPPGWQEGHSELRAAVVPTSARPPGGGACLTLCKLLQGGTGDY